MNKEELQLLHQWEHSMLRGSHDDVLCIDETFDVPRQIYCVTNCVLELLRDQKTHFSEIHAPPVRGPILRSTATGKRMLECFKTDWFLIARTYPRHEFNPYIHLFENLAIREGIDRLELAVVTADQLNNFVSKLRTETKQAGFQKRLQRQKRLAEENALSMHNCIEDLFCHYGKVLVVRTDFSFKNVQRQLSAGSAVNPEYAQSRFAAFMKHLKRKFPDMICYARKLEYGERTTYHYHCIFFFNGQKVWKDIDIGTVLCERWHKVTKGLGRASNVNKDKDRYREKGLLGVGMIHYWDKPMRERLHVVAAYLTKVDYYVRLKLPAGIKTFTRGEVRSPSSGRRGRPRSIGTLIAERTRPGRLRPGLRGRRGKGI